MTPSEVPAPTSGADPAEFSIRCSTVIMLELRSLRFFAPNQKTLFPAYRIGVMLVRNWLVFKGEDCLDCLT
ncbi:hypothetical protein VULLAG_LOCUS13424 [Vulpes lagopus]